MNSSSNVYDYYYENYLILYNLYGRGRPRLKRDQYEKLDQELMALVSRGEESELSREQIARVRDIEYMLLDDIAESLLDKRG
ncbi:MAG: hypothetical protein HUU03_07355 [Planctomycetaceae bacterium]|nr:hypothetical protein [Planctomycetota bacterium]NUO16242.1 hypothetical protein [Planctomycetaceae bacterium]GIK51277.1 MAG: hypothetical protein BroJett014_02500 [Planctomycetota bacterium]HRJ79554.1 hypothetical protein [Planctomycetota bacterium]